jgi:hypothetical protein
MRTSDVARRSVCLELLTQRVSLEQQAADLGDDASALHDGLVGAVDALKLASSFVNGERTILAASIGSLDLDEPKLDAYFADLAVLLWCLGRIPRMLTVAQLQDGMGDFLTRGYTRGYLAEAEGDLEKVARALESAKLRPREELVAELTDIAKANALHLTGAGGAPATTDVPPMTVFYILPWILSSEWPWGQACDLRIDAGPLAGLEFTPEGIKVPRA